MRELLKGTTKLLLSVVTLCTVIASVMDASSEVKNSARMFKDAYKTIKRK